MDKYTNKVIDSPFTQKKGEWGGITVFRGEKNNDSSFFPKMR